MQYYCSVLRYCKLERDIRTLKKEQACADVIGDTETSEMLQAKINAKSKEINAWCNNNSLKRDYSRELVQEQLQTKNSFTPSQNDSIMELNKRSLHTDADPLKEVLGEAEQSHPNEIQSFIKEINENGVELIRSDFEERLSYQPSVISGKAGRLTISKGASYGAWLHEIQHLRDDKKAGWIGMRIIQDPKKAFEWETNAYMQEIRLARSLNRDDIAQRLIDNLEERRRLFDEQ